MAQCPSPAEAVREEQGCCGSNEVSLGDFKLGLCWLIVVREDYIFRETELLYSDTF